MLLTLLSGCWFLGEETATVAELEVELANNTDESYVFHIAPESDDGLGEWTSREIEAGADETLVLEPDDGEQMTTLHGVVNGHATSTDLLLGETGEICPKVVFAVGVAEEPQLLLSSRVSC